MNKKQIILMPHQEKFVYSRNKVTVMLCGRGAGKSVAGGFLIANKLTNGFSGLAIAPTYSVLESVLVRETKKILSSYGWSFNYNKQRKELTIIDPKTKKQLAMCYFRSAENEEIIRGLSDLSFLVMDEAALVSQECYDIAIATLRGAEVRNPKQYLISTPRGKANWVSALFENPKYNAIHATSADNTLLDPEYVQDLLDKYGDDFAQQEVYGKILDGTVRGLFPGAMIEKFKQNKEMDITGDYTIGYDIGGEGDDYSAIAVRRGNDIVHLERRSTPDNNSLDVFLGDILNTYPASRCYIDSTGLGHFIPSRLADVYPKVEMVGVSFGAGSLQSGYANRRTEIYFELKKRINNGLHLHLIDPKLVTLLEQEMYATEYKIADKTTDFAIIPKGTIKKILRRSPDLLDAVCLACANGSSITKEAVRKANEHILKSKIVAPRRRSR